MRKLRILDWTLDDLPLLLGLRRLALTSIAGCRRFLGEKTKLS